MYEGLSCKVPVILTDLNDSRILGLIFENFFSWKFSRW